MLILDQLISGWQWNGILTAQSGLPFTPTAGSNRSGSGDTANPDVPNRNPAFSGPVITGDPNRWFNPQAFLLPMAGTYGNAGAQPNLQFRAEAFNILNRANFGQPSIGVYAGTNISPSAGVITSTATTSRQLQFALKLTF